MIFNLNNFIFFDVKKIILLEWLFLDYSFSTIDKIIYFNEI